MATTLRFAIIIAGLVCSACGTDRDVDVGLLTDQVRQLSDTEEIRSLLLAYGRYLDDRDFESYSQLFAADGEWIGGFGTVQGPDAIREFMEENLPGPNPGNTYHLLSNFDIAIDGNEARAWSRWAFVTGGSSDTPTIAQGGHYIDVLIREDGRWKFRRREAVLDIPVSFP